MQVEELPGIRAVKDFVAITSGDESRVDLSKQFMVTGYSKRDNKDFFVVINGRILSQGDLLDGMMITQIKPNRVLLQEDGKKFKIDYNLQ